MTEVKKRNLTELFEFWRILGENNSLKTKFFELPKRSDRENFINNLGFNSSSIRKALSEIQIEAKGKQFSLLEWLDNQPQENTTESPVSAAVSALKKNRSSESLKNIEKKFAHHIDVLKGKPGALAHKPIDLAPKDQT